MHSLTTTLVALSAGALMPQAGIAKRRLVWKPRREKRDRRRRRPR
jgi:hypothetical protein